MAIIASMYLVKRRASFKALSEVQNILNSALFNGAAVEVTAFDAEFCLKPQTENAKHRKLELKAVPKAVPLSSG